MTTQKWSFRFSRRIMMLQRLRCPCRGLGRTHEISFAEREWKIVERIADEIGSPFAIDPAINFGNAAARRVDRRCKTGCGIARWLAVFAGKYTQRIPTPLQIDCFCCRAGICRRAPGARVFRFRDKAIARGDVKILCACVQDKCFPTASVPAIHFRHASALRVDCGNHGRCGVRGIGKRNRAGARVDWNDQ